MVKYYVDIYEVSPESVSSEGQKFMTLTSNLVVTHIFYGESQREAYNICVAHKKTDSFLRAALDYGEWEGIRLLVESGFKGA